MSGPFTSAKEMAEHWIQKAKDNEADALRLHKEKCDCLDAKRAAEAEVARLEGVIKSMSTWSVRAAGALSAQPDPVPAIQASQWLVYSREHNAFWRANRSGYTVDVESAGRYSYEEAFGLCTARDPQPDGSCSEFTVPAPECCGVLGEAERAVVEAAMMYHTDRIDYHYDEFLKACDNLAKLQEKGDG